MKISNIWQITPKSRDCFEGVDIAGGVCYFLWDSTYSGDCYVINKQNGTEYGINRKLNEFDIFIRYNKAIDIIKKIDTNDNFAMLGFTSNPFSFRSFIRGSKIANNDSVVLITSSGITYIDKINLTKNKEAVSKYKVCFGKINPDRGGVNGNTSVYNVINKPFIAKPNEIISETYLLANIFDNEKETINCRKYFTTKFVRFLIFVTLTSMNITNSNLKFVPMQDFNEEWTDEKLYKKYNLTQEEIDFIESMIKPME